VVANANKKKTTKSLPISVLNMPSKTVEIYETSYARMCLEQFQLRMKPAGKSEKKEGGAFNDLN
jgi:hypothetical protein